MTINEEQEAQDELDEDVYFERLNFSLDELALVAVIIILSSFGVWKLFEIFSDTQWSI